MDPASQFGDGSTSADIDIPRIKPEPLQAVRVTPCQAVLATLGFSPRTGHPAGLTGEKAIQNFDITRKEAGARALYVNPEECIHCGACEPECFQDASYFLADLAERCAKSLESNRAFFTDLLPGLTTSAWSAWGISKVGSLEMDRTFRVAPGRRQQDI